jgi:hypothetical protein
MVLWAVTLCSIAMVSTIWEEYVAPIFRVNVIMMRMLLLYTYVAGKTVIQQPERERKNPHFL